MKYKSYCSTLIPIVIVILHNSVFRLNKLSKQLIKIYIDTMIYVQQLVQHIAQRLKQSITDNVQFIVNLHDHNIFFLLSTLL